MAGINNRFMLANEPPLIRYKKTIPTNISGKRLNLDGTKELDFLLTGDDDGSVIEIYSEKEHEYFKRCESNRYFFEEGLITVWDESTKPISMKNFLTDDDIKTALVKKRKDTVTNFIKDITSLPTLNRVFMYAQDMGLSRDILDVIEYRIQQVKQA